MSPFVIHDESNDKASLAGRETAGRDMLKLLIDEDPNGDDIEAGFAMIYIDKKQARILGELLLQFSKQV